MLTETIDYKLKYEQSEKQIALLMKEKSLLQEQLSYYINARYASKTEQISNSNQLTLFDEVNEAEETADYTVPEPTVEEVTVKRTYRPKGKRERDLSKLPTNRIIVEPENKNCSNCGGEMIKISEEVIRRELEYTPAQYKVNEYIAETFACNNCKDGEIATGKLSDEQQPIIGGSIATPSLVAGIVNQKYSLGIPLARQEQEMKRHGVVLSRQTMANWMLRSSDDLEPIYNALFADLKIRSHLHGDESRLKVVTHDPKNGIVTDKNSYVWQFRTSGNTDKPIVIYAFGDGRKYDNVTKFLEGFKGTLHCDGYQAYQLLLTRGVILAICWTHMRRKFTDTLKSNGHDLTKLNLIPKDEPALIGLKFCNALYKIEEGAKKFSDVERLKIRLEKSKPIVDDFFKWVKTLRPEHKSKLEKAYTYAINQEEFLCTFLTDGNVEIDNNRAERTFKPFVIGRKNWLFSQSDEGAKASAQFYSLVETAKENGLIPYEYIKYLLEMLRLGKLKLVDGSVDVALLPWSKTLPDCVRL